MQIYRSSTNLSALFLSKNVNLYATGPSVCIPSARNKIFEKSHPLKILVKKKMHIRTFGNFTKLFCNHFPSKNVNIHTIGPLHLQSRAFTIFLAI